MTLTNFKTLSTEEKLAVLRTTAGLQQLEEWLVSGLSLNKIACIMGIHSETMYRWRAKYPDIAEVTEPYAPIPTEPIANLSRPLAYRIIYAYEAYGKNFKGCVIGEFDTLEKVWSSGFVQQYFSSFGKSEADYLSAYLVAMDSTGLYKLSNLYLITYCIVSKKGLIKPQSRLSMALSDIY